MDWRYTPDTKPCRPPIDRKAINNEAEHAELKLAIIALQDEVKALRDEGKALRSQYDLMNLALKVALTTLADLKEAKK